ncbi:MAG: FliM/FliN family flagellar motor switch protein [Hyphomicrobiales bacterium]|uniref:FliM/FliN family flagellar motor switch protein n=1 Tax=Alphaproteobacteria TaxID=28211 RepID=UPI003264E86B
MSFENWPLPKFEIRQDDIAMWNAAMSLSGQPLPLAGGAHFTFTPCTDLSSLTGVLTSVVSNGRVRAYIGMEDFPFGSLSGASLSINDLRDMPEDLAAALRQGMIQTVLDSVGAELQSSFEIGQELSVSEVSDGDQSQDLSWFEVVLQREREGQIVFVLGVAPAIACSELAARLPSADAFGSELGRMIPIRVERLVGTAELLWSEVSNLAPGDCILISPTEADGHLAVVASDRVFSFAQAEGNWACAKAIPLKQMLSKRSETAFAFEGNGGLDTGVADDEVGSFSVEAPLRIGLSFRLGSACLSASDVAGWKLGSVTDLPDGLKDNDASVRVVSNDTTIGQGDLVRVGDRIGVRLSRVFLDN